MFSREFTQKYKWVPGVIVFLALCVNIFPFLAGTATWVTVLNIIMVPGILSFFFWKTFGQPANWWVPWFGTCIRLDAAKYKDISWSELDHTFEQWFKDSGIEWYWQQSTFEYHFLWKKQASQFKLTWG